MIFLLTLNADSAPSDPFCLYAELVVSVRAHEVDSRQLKLLATGCASLLVKVPCGALHLGDFALEIADVVQIFVELL